MTYVAQPSGPGGPVFTFDDLLLTITQATWSGEVYFGNTTDTILCEDSVLNPAVQWCAPAAEPGFVIPKYVPVPYSPGTPAPTTTYVVVPPPPPPPHVSVTPEPTMLPMALAASIMMITVVRWLRG